MFVLSSLERKPIKLPMPVARPASRGSEKAKRMLSDMGYRFCRDKPLKFQSLRDKFPV